MPDEPVNETLKDSRDRGHGPVLGTHWYLFVALEADRPLAGGARYLLTGTDEVIVGRGAERAAGRSAEDGVRRLVLRLPGKSLSGIHARIVRSYNGWTLEDAGSTNGCFVNGKKVQRVLLGQDDIVEVGHSFLFIRMFPLAADRPPADCDSRQLTSSVPLGFGTLVPTGDAKMQELSRIAQADVTVVLCGETGTGKELLARGIHALSRRKGPFVALNCGALTETLAESQLFGHVRGAFTGAVADSVGFVRAADGGTLLLDEVGDLDRTAQVALLRVLQEREVTPVGSARTSKVDVRFVASSPQPLDPQVQGAGFRADLYARLSGYTFVTTPLRHRREDVGMLIAALLARIGVSPANQPTLTVDAALSLLRHAWPLNVRQLEQTLRRSWALSTDGVIQNAHLSLDEAAADGAPARKPPGAELVLSPEEHELRRQIIDELGAASGNVAVVARKLGKARMQIHRWMKRFAIDPEAYRR